MWRGAAQCLKGHYSMPNRHKVFVWKLLSESPLLWRPIYSQNVVCCNMEFSAFMIYENERDCVVNGKSITLNLTMTQPVTAHFVAPAQFVAGNKLSLRWRHISSPPCTIWRLATKCAAVAHTVLGRQNVPYVTVIMYLHLHILSSLIRWTQTFTEIFIC